MAEQEWTTHESRIDFTKPAGVWTADDIASWRTDAERAALVAWRDGDEQRLEDQRRILHLVDYLWLVLLSTDDAQGGPEMLGAFRHDLIDVGIEHEMIGPLLVEALRATLVKDDLITDEWKPRERPVLVGEWCACDKHDGRVHPYRENLGAALGRPCPEVRVKYLGEER